MALPTQEIEKLARVSAVGQGVYRQLLLLAGALFAISAILYLGLYFGYEPYLQGQQTALTAQIQDFSKQISAEDQAKLTAFYSQLVNLQTLLGQHGVPSEIFNWLEKNTQLNTYFTKTTLNFNTYQLSLLGNAKTPDDVSEQTAILESQPEVLRLNFNSLTVVATGGWQFNLTVFLDPKAFGSFARTAPAGAGAIVPSVSPGQSLPPAGTSSRPSAASTPNKP